MLQIHGVADGYIESAIRTITVKDNEDMVTVIVGDSYIGTVNLTPDQARFIARILIKSADRVEGGEVMEKPPQKKSKK